MCLRLLSFVCNISISKVNCRFCTVLLQIKATTNDFFFYYKSIRWLFSHICRLQITFTAGLKKHFEFLLEKWLQATICRHLNFARFADPHSFRVQLHCRKYKSQICSNVWDVSERTTNKTPDVIPMLCVEVNMYVRLRSDPLTEVT